MTDDFLHLLSENPIFCEFDEEQRAIAVACAVHRRYETGEFVAHYRDVWPYLFMVETGCVEGTKESTDGRQLTVLSLEAGEIFWGLAFFNDEMETPVALLAREASSIKVWSRDELLPLLLGNPMAIWKLSQKMVRRMNQASQILEGLAFQPVAGRLARFLLDQFTDAGKTSLNRSLTLDDIAARIGSTREMVCRALYQFSDKNFIEITRTEFILIDETGLAQFAET